MQPTLLRLFIWLFLLPESPNDRSRSPCWKPRNIRFVSYVVQSEYQRIALHPTAVAFPGTNCAKRPIGEFLRESTPWRRPRERNPTAGRPCSMPPQPSSPSAAITPPACATSRAAIAMTPGAIYFHVASKQALLLAVYEEGVQRDFVDRVEAAVAAEREPWARLEKTITAPF